MLQLSELDSPPPLKVWNFNQIPTLTVYINKIMGYTISSPINVGFDLLTVLARVVESGIVLTLVNVFPAILLALKCKWNPLIQPIACKVTTVFLKTLNGPEARP